MFSDKCRTGGRPTREGTEGLNPTSQPFFRPNPSPSFEIEKNFYRYIEF